MVLRTRFVMCILVLFVTVCAIEARWHSSRKHQETRDPISLDYRDDPDYEDQSRSIDQDDEEDVEERRLSRHRLMMEHRRHRKHRHRKLEPMDYNDEDEDRSLRYRGKRHNRSRPWTDKDRKAFNSSRRPELYDHDVNIFEVEVREAQNSSLCNYTVVPIPDPGGRIPRELEHVKCNYVGNRCGDRGTYCCIQTYRHVEVLYPGGRNDTIKVYSGCVCSELIYGKLKPYYPKLELDQ